jgi:predicted amidohydrolase YtcJ
MRRSRALLTALWVGVVCLCGALALGPAPRAFGAAGPADLVLLHGKVVTVDSRFSIAQAVAIEQDRIAAVGTDAQIQQYVGPRTRVIDLHGRTVIPGLIDSHIHAIRAGLTYDYEVHWDRVTSLAEGLRMVREQATRTPPGTWIVVAGGWHESQFAEKRIPTMADLDVASADHPIWVQRLYERAIMNRVAVRTLGITVETSNPFGGEVLKDPSGQPTGVVTGFGGINAFYFKIPRPALDEQIRSMRDWFRELNRLGLTSVGDVAGGGLIWPRDYQAVTALHDGRELTLRVRWYMQPNRPGGEMDAIRQFVATVQPGSGDDWLRPIGIGEQVLASVYDGDAFGPLPPQFSPKAIEEWRQTARFILESGWRFQVHATRNHSAEQLLPAIEEINREIPVGPRRLSFAHMEDVSPETIRRIKAIGGGITVQDRLVYSGEEVAHNWPEEMSRKAPPIKTMLAMGIPVGGGTDSTRVAPYNPFISLWWLVTGKTVAGVRVRGPAESVGRILALRVYTIGSAWFNMDEDRVGSITTGKYADLAVLSGDYLTVPEDEIKSLASVLTIVGGKPVYAAGDYQSLASP